ncbi:MAG: hypothetical protein ACPGLV_19400, partial [Bacteroidia bacterium]
MRYLRYIVLTLFCAFCLVFSALAQNYSATVRNFGVANGLSHHDARSVAVDSRGLVWVGTRYGLNRFDGNKFKSFYVEDGLKSNNIELLFADGDILICVHKSRTIEEIVDLTIFNSVTEQTISFNEWCGLTNVTANDVIAIDANKREIVFCAVINDVAHYYLKKRNQPAKEFKSDLPSVFIGSCMDGTYWFQNWQNNSIVKRDFEGKILRTVSTKFLKTWPGEFYVDMRLGEHEEWLFAYDSLYQISGNRLKHVKQLWGPASQKNKLVQLPSEFVRKHEYSGL